MGLVNNIKKSLIGIPLILALGACSPDIYKGFKNPEYKITNPIEFESRTYKANIRDSLKELADKGSNYISKREDFINNLERKDTFLENKYNELKSQRRSIVSKRKDLCTPNRYKKEKWHRKSFDINTTAVLEKTVKSATGKEIPEKLNIKYGIWDFWEEEGIDKMGHYNSTLQNIKIKKGPEAEKIMIGLHELGHAFAQHREAGIYEDEEKEAVMEEASAFAFSIASSYFIKDSSLGRRVRDRTWSYIHGKINGYFNTNVENSEHNKGAIIADAAITYFKDPGKAYNYLSTTHYNDLKGDFFNIILNNKLAFNNHNLYFGNKLEKIIGKFSKK